MDATLEDDMMRTLGRSFATALALLIATSCGGGSTGPTQMPPPDEAPTPLDFSAIAGTWTGPGTFTSPAEDTGFTLTLDLQSAVPRGAIVGTAAVDWNSGEQCGSDLLASDVQGNLYTAEDRVRFGCDVNGGAVRLLYDPATATIAYTWLHPDGFDWDVTATLTRP